MTFLPSTITTILIVLGLILILLGTVVYYVEYSINYVVNKIEDTIGNGAIGIANGVTGGISKAGSAIAGAGCSAGNAISHFFGGGDACSSTPSTEIPKISNITPKDVISYDIPSMLIGWGLFCIVIPFLDRLVGVILIILKEKTFSIKDSVILMIPSYFLTRIVDMFTSNLNGIDMTAPYEALSIGFIGITLPAAVFVGHMVNNKIRNKKIINVKDFSWLISSGVTLIFLAECLLSGKIIDWFKFDNTGNISRLLLDLGYAYVLIPLSIYLYGIIHNVITKKTINVNNIGVKNILILFVVGFSSTYFVGVFLNKIPNVILENNAPSEIVYQILTSVLFILGLFCITVSLVRVTISIMKYYKNKDRVKIKNFPHLIIKYVNYHNIVKELEKLTKHFNNSSLKKYTVSQDPLDVLKMRLAKSEISLKEFDELKTRMC